MALLNLPALGRKCPARDDLETTMNARWLVIGFSGLALAGLVAAEPAEAARKKYKAPRAVCADSPAPFSWRGLFFNGKPQPNGCAPAVFEYGEYIGQDPDPNVRAALRRDPNTGYTQYR
jgi:hypothetical protein